MNDQPILEQFIAHVKLVPLPANGEECIRNSMLIVRCAGQSWASRTALYDRAPGNGRLFSIAIRNAAEYLEMLWLARKHQLPLAGASAMRIPYELGLRSLWASSNPNGDMRWYRWMSDETDKWMSGLGDPPPEVQEIMNMVPKVSLPLSMPKDLRNVTIELKRAGHSIVQDKNEDSEYNQVVRTAHMLTHGNLFMSGWGGIAARSAHGKLGGAHSVVFL